jgi:hypothetical protein
MLRDDVIDAVAAGKFGVYPVGTIDQAAELLTGVPAGEMDETGNFPAGSLNQRVAARLVELLELHQEIARSARGIDDDEEHGKASD